MQETLFVSFWDIRLDNLPEGAFTHRSIAPEDARVLVEQTRQNNTLIGVSGEDLLAPYKKRELYKHQELCQVLNEQFGIALSLNDFTGDSEHENKTFCSVLPLQCVQVQGDDKLMVITCAYSLPEKGISPESMDFEIAPPSLEFHLIEPQGGS